MAVNTLEQAIDAWRQTKHPRFALVAKVALERALNQRPREPVVDETWNAVFAANDPLDVPRLIAALGTSSVELTDARRVDQLHTRNDPNVVTGIIEVLRELPERLRESTSVFRACLRLLQQSRDPRTREAVEVAQERFATVLFGPMRNALTGLAQKALKKWPRGTQDESLNELATTLEAAFPSELSKERSFNAARNARRDTLRGLLAAIYAAPDDDGPRMVFADELTERGDPRGEFINLQLARARGPVSDEEIRREQALRPKRAGLAEWGLPLSQAGHVDFRRGFPWWITLEGRAASTIVGEPALRLLERLHRVDVEFPPGIERTLFNCDQLHGLKEVRGLSGVQLDVLDRPRAWQSIELVEHVSAGQLRHLPLLHSVQVTANTPLVGQTPLTMLRKLKRLHLILPVEGGALERWLDGVHLIEELRLSRTDSTAVGFLRRLPELRRLQLYSVSGNSLAGLALESLMLFNDDPIRLIAEVPTLKHLSFFWWEAIHHLPAFLRSASPIASLTVPGFELLHPFTERGVARLSPHLMDEKAREATSAVLRQLTVEHVQCVEVAPRPSERFLLEDVTSMKKLIELASANTTLPVVRRWQ